MLGPASRHSSQPLESSRSSFMVRGKQSFSELAIRLTLEFKRCFTLQKTEELFPGKDGAKLDMAVLLDNAELLAGFEIK